MAFLFVYTGEILLIFPFPSEISRIATGIELQCEDLSLTSLPIDVILNRDDSLESSSDSLPSIRKSVLILQPLARVRVNACSSNICTNMIVRSFLFGWHAFSATMQTNSRREWRGRNKSWLARYFWSEKCVQSRSGRWNMFTTHYAAISNGQLSFLTRHDRIRFVLWILHSRLRSKTKAKGARARFSEH